METTRAGNKFNTGGQYFSMPISITASADRGVLAIESLVGQAERDAKYALRTTLNQTAFAGMRELQNAYKKYLDRPVPYIYRAYFVRKATSLENPVAALVVKVGGRDEGVDPYIDAITRTGKHVPTRLTKRFRRSGLLRSGESLQPTRGVKRNARGNVSGSYVSTLLQKKNKAIIIERGDYRGIYSIVGGRFRKVYTPARVGRYRTNPAVDVTKALRPVILGFDKLFKENYARNQARTQARR